MVLDNSTIENLCKIAALSNSIKKCDAYKWH